MSRRPRTLWPTGPRTAFFSDAASRPTLAAAVHSGAIRRIATGVWSADLHSDPADIVAENIWPIVARVMPDAVLVDRTAAAGGRITDGIVTVATDQRTTDLDLPGLIVVVRPRRTHPSDLPWIHGLTLASPARALVDNLTPSRRRTRAARTLSNAELRDWLAERSLTWGSERMAVLRAAAEEVARDWGDAGRLTAIADLFEGLTAPPSRAGDRPTTTFADAVRYGVAWDRRRIAMFETASRQAQSIAVDEIREPVVDGELPFFEAYFSNYIEGTEFTIDEARTIVVTNMPPARRPADGHDILGTYRCVVDPVGRARTSTDPTELTDLLRTRHRTVMIGRPAIGPGVYKDTANRAGVTTFVDPSLVVGTLTKALADIEDIPAGFPRAVYMMFVIAEVHPFTDGNGRAARLMMNAELSAAHACRIVIPTILRDDYIGALRRASADDGDLTALVAALGWAWRWTAAMPWDNRVATDGQLLATNAVLDPVDAQQRRLFLQLP